MNDNEIQAKSKLKTFGEFWIGGVQFILTTPATGQILTFTSASTVENTTDPTLNPYTSFVLNPTTKKLETYKSGVLTENLDFPALFVTATELATILSGYATTSSLSNVWRIHLNSGGTTGDVATRISGLTEVTDYPAGWVLSVGSTPTSLVVTHGLGRELASIHVWSKDPSTSKRQEMKGDLGYVALYSASDLDSFEIDSLAGVARELYIYPIFY